MFKNVHFRVETPSYYNSKYGVGFDQEDREKFNAEVLNLFLNDGWQLKEEKYKSIWGCNRVIKDKQELYLHPQDFSGVVKVENIPYIEQLINSSTMFKLRCIDAYEEVFDITDEEYMNILKSKEKDIKQDLLETFKTKRSNLFIVDTWTAISRVLNKYKIKRLKSYIGVTSSDNADVQYFEELFKELISQGEIVTMGTKHGKGYRTRKDKELKFA